MSAIAIALLEKGYSVSGSDIVENELIRKLKTLGSYIFLIQTEKNISFIKDKYYGVQAINKAKQLFFPNNKKEADKWANSWTADEKKKSCLCYIFC